MRRLDLKMYLVTKSCDDELYDSIVGVLWGFLEYAQVARFLNNLVPSLARAFRANDATLQLHALGCLHMLVARNQVQSLLERPDLLQIVKTQHDALGMNGYIAAHIVATVLEQGALSQDMEQSLTTCLIAYVKRVNVPQLRQIEEHHHFRWVGLDPFLALLPSRRVPVLHLCVLSWAVMLVNPTTLQVMSPAMLERIYALYSHPLPGIAQMARKWFPNNLKVVPSLKAIAACHLYQLGLD